MSDSKSIVTIPVVTTAHLELTKKQVETLLECNPNRLIDPIELYDSLNDLCSISDLIDKELVIVDTISQPSAISPSRVVQQPVVNVEKTLVLVIKQISTLMDMVAKINKRIK
jgi:hypothetical protein